MALLLCVLLKYFAHYLELKSLLKAAVLISIVLFSALMYFLSAYFLKAFSIKDLRI
jgi:hypothetical protein